MYDYSAVLDSRLDEARCMYLYTSKYVNMIYIYLSKDIVCQTAHELFSCNWLRRW